jgi:hypothetical protein
VWAIGQCASLAMVEVVTHQAKVEDEPVSARIARSLNQWKPEYIDIPRRFMVKGRRSEHMFDFASISRNPEANSVVIKVLAPSFGPLAQARLYGFMVLDIEGRDVSDWPRLAVITKMEEWSQSAVELARSLSSDVIALESDREESVERILPKKMQELTDAA